MAGEPLPRKYRLDEVSVRLTRRPGTPGLSVRNLSLSGTGSARLEIGVEKIPFRYDAKNMMILLNDLYRIRFFDLPVDYTAKYSVFLREDGSIGTQALAMADASSTRICVAIANYEKCVMYGNGGPRDLEDIVQRQFAEAERQARPKTHP